MPPSRTSNSTPSPTKFSQVDYSLPPPFLALLDAPLESTLDRLLPIRAAPRAASSPPGRGVTTTRVDPQNTSLHPFIQAMAAAPDTLTENGAQAYRETLSPLVDLFFDMVPGLSTPRLNQLLANAWTVDPSSTMQIIIHARSIHEGKGMEEMFYRCMAWVWAHHPRTMLANLHLIIDPTCVRDRSKARDETNAQRDLERRVRRDLGVLDLDDDGNVEGPQEEKEDYPPRPHGCFKDLLDLLTLHINGQLDPNSEHNFDACKEAISPNVLAGHKFVKLRKARRTSAQAKLGHDIGQSVKFRAARVCNAQSFTKSVWLAQDRKAKDKLLRERFEKAVTTDKKFQALYLVVLDLFYKQLRLDLGKLAAHKDFIRLPLSQRGKWKGNSSPHLFGMSYAAKWAASPGKTVDRQYMFASALALKFHPALDLNVARMKLQQEVLSPLRQATKVPELSMVNGPWSIDYTKVPARCMARNGDNFAEHDPQGLERYLRKVPQGSATVSGASLFPHELLIDAMKTSNGDNIKSRLADLQWRTLVDSLRSSSKTEFENSLAVADVSGSMGSLGCDKIRPNPIAPCIALTLLLGELAKPPWSGGFFTFSSQPTFEKIDTNLPLSQRANRLHQAHWGMSTSFYKVFDLILTMAQQHRLPPEHMVKRLFVFSDMQFDQATNGSYGETEHQAIQRKFANAGYAMPDIVYWNLAGRAAGTPKPVRADEKGVSLVSGWSGALMKFFLRQQADEALEEAEEQEWEHANVGQALNTILAPAKKDPLQIVMKTISDESFRGVVIVD